MKKSHAKVRNSPSESTARPPRPAPSLFPVVGIGASAGGLEAILQLLKSLPSDTGLAFVVIQHLDPTRESILASLLARATKMPVDQVTDGMRVEPDRVYVFPPNVSMSMENKAFKLVPRLEPRELHMPVDHFFLSLARLGSRAVGIILSGTGTDGTSGLARIKESGGITFAQEEATAKFAGMPRSAIATGSVDFVLPVDGIAQELVKIALHSSSKEPIPPLSADGQNGSGRILQLVRSAKGVDFSQYKNTTISRRIARRMALAKIEDHQEYARLLREKPDELKALYQDLLIKVTSFFRDPKTYKALKVGVIPKLMGRHSNGEPIRIWVPGCATGEEVYSIAICFLEAVSKKARTPSIQIFATDIDEESLQKARAGLYNEDIAAVVSAERLKCFFTRVGPHYQVNKTIREMCTFAKHDLGKDPPFSNLDLISCKNVLIYFKQSLQKQVIPIFHYALKPAGFLALGTSETIGTSSDLFNPADKKSKIYAKNTIKKLSTVDFAPWDPRQAGAGTAPKGLPADPSRSNEVDVFKEADRVLLNHYVPAGVLVNEQMDILQFRGDTGRYLQSSPGKASLNLLRMVREGLFVEIKSALALAKKTGAPVIREDIRVKFEGKFLDVGLKVIPLHSPEHPAHDFLVLFEEPRLRQRKPGKRESKVSKQEAGASENSSLRHELDMTKEYLQSTIENQDVTNEELKSSNEEILSSNEELQSTNEELETAKEELQSTNEELITANEEVKSRNFELIESNKELAFQSKEKEKRAAELIVANKELAFQNKEKEKRAAELIVANKELVFQSKEKEKRAAELGVANKELAFQNKEKEKRAAELAQANSDLDNLISSANVAIIMLGSDLCVRQFTKSAERALHIKAADIGRPVSRLELDIHVPDLESLVASAVKSGRIKEREVQNKQGHWHNIQIRPFKTGEDKIEGALIVYIDIQSIKGVEKLTRSLSELEAARKYNQWIVESVQIPLIILDHNLRIITANPAFYQTFKVSEEKTEKQSIYDLGNGQWNIPKLKQLLEDILPQSKVFNNFQVEHVFPDLGRRIMTLNARRLEHQNQILLAIEDITDRKNIEGLLAVEKRNLEKVNHELDQFVHMASHDLRSPLRVICSFAEILEKDCQGKLNPESVDSLKHIILGTQRMNELITDLLTLSRITKVENPYEPVNIGDLIGSVKRRLQAEIERSNALITTHDSLSAVVCCFDRIKMREVFTNLIHNAIKYSSKHSGDRPQVEIGMTGQKDHYEFSVKDNGIGIDPRYHQQIFDMFKRLHSKDQYEGTGAGLYIVKTIVEEHGGRVWVESQLGQGATFYFTIPKDLKAGNEGPAEALQLAGVTA